MNTLKVFYAGQQVPGSPFKVDLRPKGPVSEAMSPNSKILEESVMVPQECWSRPHPTKNLPISSPNPVHRGTSFSECHSRDKQQRDAPLVATAVGEKTGKVPVSITQNPDGTRDVYFNPEKADLYKIDVLLGDLPVPNSPIVVKYLSRSDPSKCFVFGLQDIPLIPQVNEPIKFGVDTTQAGDGKLSVTADGPSADELASKLDVKLSDENPRIGYVTYTPSAKVFIASTFSGQGANSASPLSFDVGRTGGVQTYPWGKPVSLDINADCKAGDLDAYAIQESNGAKHKVKISKLQKESSS